MGAPLPISRTGRLELVSKIAWAVPALALGIAAVGPVLGEARAAPPSDASRVPTEQFPAALTPPYPDANDPVALGRWFGETTHLPAKSILAITDNAIFAAFPQHTSGPFWTVDVRLESITPQSTEKLGGRSVRLRLNVRCDNNTVRLNFLDAYPGADLTGAPAHRAPTNDWALPKPNSYVADAVRLACDKTFQGPLAGIEARASAPKIAPKPPIKPQAASASPEPIPALRPRAPLVGGYAVQIGAYSTAAMSQEAWRALKAAMPDKTTSLSNATTRVQVGGHTFYRAIVQGFPSNAAAATFCESLRASGRACLMAGGVKP
jgi:hypothetical protein